MGPVRTPALHGQGECSLSSGSKTNIQPTRVPLPRANPQGGVPRGTAVPTVGGYPRGMVVPTWGGVPRGRTISQGGASPHRELSSRRGTSPHRGRIIPTRRDGASPQAGFLLWEAMGAESE